MNLKSKILAAGLAVIIAGGAIGIAVFFHSPQIIRYSNIGCVEEGKSVPHDGMDCCPGLIADPGCENCDSDSWTCRKPADCGNGTCETVETAASCPADCGQPIANCAKEGEVFVDDSKQCCSGLEKQ